MRGYTSLRDVRGRSAASAHRPGLSRPGTHDEEHSDPSTLTNRAPVGCAPEHCRPGPARKEPCSPRPQHQDLRVPIPTLPTV